MKLIPLLSVSLLVLDSTAAAKAQGTIAFNDPWVNDGISQFSLAYQGGFSFRVNPPPPEPHNNVTHVGAIGPVGYPHNGTPFAAFVNTLGIPQFVAFAFTNAATFGDHAFLDGAPFGLTSVDLVR